MRSAPRSAIASSMSTWNGGPSESLDGASCSTLHLARVDKGENGGFPGHSLEAHAEGEAEGRPGTHRGKANTDLIQE